MAVLCGIEMVVLLIASFFFFSFFVIGDFTADELRARYVPVNVKAQRRGTRLTQGIELNILYPVGGQL